MKVLVIGSGFGYIGGKSYILSALLEAGHNVVHRTVEELEAERPQWKTLSVDEYPDLCGMMGCFKPETLASEVKPKHQPKGPRGRWGKLK